MFERNYSERKKDMLKKTTNILGSFWTSQNITRFLVGAVALVTVFLMQVSAGSQRGAKLGNEVVDYSTNSKSSQSTVQADDNQATTPASPAENPTSNDIENNNQSTTEVTVNGVQVPVPENGTVEQTITDPESGNQSTVNIDIQSDSSSDSDDNDGSSRIRVRSRSNTDVRIRTSN